MVDKPPTNNNNNNNTTSAIVAIIVVIIMVLATLYIFQTEFSTEPVDEGEADDYEEEGEAIEYIYTLNVRVDETFNISLRDDTLYTDIIDLVRSDIEPELEYIGYNATEDDGGYYINMNWTFKAVTEGEAMVCFYCPNGLFDGGYYYVRVVVTA